MPSWRNADPHGRRDPWLRLDGDGAITFPLAGQPGHSATTVVRRQPVRIVDGQMEGGYTGTFEVICCQCGDHPYLDYSEISSRLQQIRGPYTMDAALAANEQAYEQAYGQHLGLVTWGREHVPPGR